MPTLKGAVQGLLTNLLDGLSSHPLITPFLRTSKDNPPEHFLHQCEVLARLAPRFPVRAFIADEIGLGKTVTAIAVAKYLEAIGRACRILIVVPRVLVLQWRKELLRMGIPSSKIRHLERWTIRELEAQGFPLGYYIASMDLLKRERHLEKVVDMPWDLIIVDEAHRFGYKTKRFFNIGKKLIEAHLDRNVLFLSATPHRGDARDYLERLKLIDPFLSDWRDLDNRRFYEATHGAILFRRTKEDVNNIYEGRLIFKSARFYACLVKASSLENRFVEDLVLFLRSKLIEFAFERGLMSERVIPLLVTLIFKRASSSPYSAYTTLQRLLVRRAGVDEKKLRRLIASVRSFLKTGYEEYEYEERDPEKLFYEFLEESSSLLSGEDVTKIEQLKDMASRIMDLCDTKLNALCNLLEWVIDSGFKVIVFTEYRDTLDYLVKQLIRKHPEWKRSILRLSSIEAHNEEEFQRIRDRFERDPSARILIATDVIAEGVNLQVANILINYEIPWSLIKLEQRIGRIWRLGQQKDVEAYTIFMNNVADEAALNSMYVKLINLKRAELKPRPFMGEEVLWYSEGEEIFGAPKQVMLEVKKEKKVFRKVTEYKAIQTFIKEGRVGLEKLVERILAAKYEIEREMRSKGVLHIPKTRDDVEQALEALGFRDPYELIESLRELLKRAGPFLGLTIKEEGSLKVAKGLEMPVTINTLNDIFGLLQTEGPTAPATLFSYGEREDKLLLLNLTVKYEDKTIYREPLGVFVKGGVVVRGATLVKEFSKALPRCFGTIEEDVAWKELPPSLQASVMVCARDALSRELTPFSNYRSGLLRTGLRDRDHWIEEHRLNIEFSRPIGCINFVKMSLEGQKEPSEDLKREVEDEAVNIVLKVETSEGRIATTVQEEEHYDIRSINPKTGEIRKIEVKGHAYDSIHAELTSDEEKLAEREGDIYWLYIIYDIKAGSPKILRFRNPLRTMNWKILERVERRVILWPKDLDMTIRGG